MTINYLGSAVQTIQNGVLRLNTSVPSEDLSFTMISKYPKLV